MKKIVLATLLCATSVAFANTASTPKKRTAIPQTRSAAEALQEITQVRTLARTASACNWEGAGVASSLANNFAPVLVGLSTRSFEACREFAKANQSLAVDEMMGSAPAIKQSSCGDGRQKAQWKALEAKYTYDAAEAAGSTTFSPDICAYQPLGAAKLSAEQALAYLLAGAEICNAQVVEKAIALGANPNSPGTAKSLETTHEGRYALGLVLEQASSSGQQRCVETAKVLLRKGANAKQEFSDKGALHLAVTAPAELVSALIEAGADAKFKVQGEAPKITIADYNAASRINVGQTPLMTFVKDRAVIIERPSSYEAWEVNESKQVLDLLTKHGDVNAQDWLGRTALMLAVEAQANVTAKVLLDAGTDKKLKDQFGRTALAYAKLMKNREMVKALSK